MNASRATRCLIALFVFLCACGCGGNTGNVSGEVRYNGKPLERGHIAFIPADGKGAPQGGAITSGHYTVADVPAGPKVVNVFSSSEEAPSIRTPEDMANMTPKMKSNFNPKTGVITADLIPSDAAGNNQRFEVGRGDQRLDVNLESKK